MLLTFTSHGFLPLGLLVGGFCCFQWALSFLLLPSGIDLRDAPLFASLLPTPQCILAAHQASPCYKPVKELSNCSLYKPPEFTRPCTMRLCCWPFYNNKMSSGLVTGRSCFTITIHISVIVHFSITVWVSVTVHSSVILLLLIILHFSATALVSATPFTIQSLFIFPLSFTLPSLFTTQLLSPFPLPFTFTLSFTFTLPFTFRLLIRFQLPFAFLLLSTFSLRI